MRRELLISAGPGEWRAALVEDGAPVELRVERGDGAEAGSIHLGRVVRLLPALGAALVEIGGERPAFLPQSEIFPRFRRLDEGERAVVQIRREAQGGKAIQLTTAVALRGRFVELLVGRPVLGDTGMLSPEGREHLLNSIGIAPPLTLPLRGSLRLPAMRGEGGGEGRLAQTLFGLRVLQSAPIEALVTDAKSLRQLWSDIGGRAAGIAPPMRLHPAATFAAAMAGVLPAI